MISYQTDGVEMPSIKKRETTEWIKSVAATYGKRVGEISLYLLLGREDTRSEPPISATRLLHRYHHFRLL